MTCLACSPEGAEVRRAVEASRATDSERDFPSPPGFTYLPFQRAGISYALEREGCLIGDEMGLGKTVQGIGVWNATENAETLVVCPASLKSNWRVEFDRWAIVPIHWGVIKGGFRGDSERGTIFIVNYDQLKHVEAKSYDLLILDEAHYIKNPDAKRTALAKELAWKAKRKLLLTGTPIANRPIELYSLLDAMGHPMTQGEKAWIRFAYRFCAPRKVWTGRRYVTSFDGASNLEELNEKLRSTCMVRRLKVDVLTDLPAKRRQVVLLDGESRTSGIDWTDGEDYAAQVAELERGKKVAFEEISTARHEEAVSKLPAALDYIKEALSEGHKIVVFAHHHDVLHGLRSGLPGCAFISGETPVADRQSEVQRFQTDENCRVFIGSIHAAGTGLTLTAASHVIFVEIDWQPGVMQQAEDRCHRIGQRESVLVQWLCTNGTLDAKIAQTLVKKIDILTKALDAVTTGPELVQAPAIAAESSLLPCTCLANPNGSEGHAKWCESVEGPFTALVRATVDPEVLARVQEALRTLAGACDGAVTEDGQGFNKLDSGFGKQLAALPTLTPRQLEAARKMLRKYKRQIGEV